MWMLINKWFMQTEFGSAWSCDQNFTILNQYISVITDINEKKFVIFEHTINRLSFALVRFSQPKHHFSFFFFLLFLPELSIYKPLNALYSRFERFKISGRTSGRLKSGVPVGGIPRNRVFQTFELLNRYN